MNLKPYPMSAIVPDNPKAKSVSMVEYCPTNIMQAGTRAVGCLDCKIQALFGHLHQLHSLRSTGSTNDIGPGAITDVSIKIDTTINTHQVSIPDNFLLAGNTMDNFFIYRNTCCSRIIHITQQSRFPMVLDNKIIAIPVNLFCRKPGVEPSFQRIQHAGQQPARAADSLNLLFILQLNHLMSFRDLY